jgi:signal transduction histidine kinase
MRWVEAPYAALRASGDLLALEGPAGTLLAGLNQPPERRADLILPLRYRFGVWQILAWDRTQPRTTYDVRTLAVTGTVATVLALLGVLLFRQQQRALRLAEERVSFVNRVSHELGSPLTNALLNVDLAAEAVATQPDFSRARLRLVTEEMQRLARLVANVLSFSRRERGALEMKPAPCVPDDIVDGVLRQFEPSLTRRSIRIERIAAAGCGVALDTDALAQIIGNLISNVEKYAAAGGWLGCETQLDGDVLVVRIADRGPGIPSAARGRIFEPFERVSSRVNEGASGTGLGLAIARDLAERMAGTLALLPSENGSVFELRLPAPPLILDVPAIEAA